MTIKFRPSRGFQFNHDSRYYVQVFAIPTTDSIKIIDAYAASIDVCFDDEYAELNTDEVLQLLL